MADVWKSQGRKFCEICKVWFGDNRASIEHHERGKKHKDALAMKLRELGKKSREKERMAAKMSTALAAMEQAALKSMKEHGEGLEHGPTLPGSGVGGHYSPSKVFDPKKFSDISSMAREMAKRKQEALKKTVPSMPKMSIKYEPVAKVAKKENNSKQLKIESMSTNDYPDQKETDETPSEIVWVEASCDDNSGRKYYWHIYSGESTWSPPSSFYTACEYQIRLAAEEACTQNASLYNTESATNFAHVKEEPHDNKAIVRLNKEQEYYQRNMHTISSENMHFPYEIPLPGECSAVKEEPLEHDIAVTTEEHLSENYGEPLEHDIAVPSEEHFTENYGEPLEHDIAVPTEENLTGDKFCEASENTNERDAENAKEHRLSAGPLGEWTRVKKEERKEPVFSPITAKFREQEARIKKELERKAKLELKINFEEKTAGTMTKKVKGPIEFKKKSAAKNIRKREDC